MVLSTYFSYLLSKRIKLNPRKLASLLLHPSPWSVHSLFTRFMPKSAKHESRMCYSNIFYVLGQWVQHYFVRFGSDPYSGLTIPKSVMLIWFLGCTNVVLQQGTNTFYCLFPSVNVTFKFTIFYRIWIVRHKHIQALPRDIFSFSSTLNSLLGVCDWNLAKAGFMLQIAGVI